MFFSQENNSKVLASFLRKAESAHIEDESRNKRLKISRTIVGYMYKAPEDWSERCSYNIKHIGNQFIEWLRDFKSSDNTSIDHIYSITYRFLCEYDFLIGAGKELNMNLSSIKRLVQEDAADMDENVHSQIIYASYVMPANIAKEFINDANIGIFKSFEQKKAEAEKLKSEWNKEIEAKKIEVDILKTKLEEYKIGFNFVGLYKGFSELVTKKKKEAFLSFLSLIGMAILILAPLITEITLVLLGMFKSKTIGTEHLYILMPLISIEVILIYFFRVILLNHRSVKVQIMQIELRQTLCQFIQSYADYASKIKEKDATALEKFENLIFSGVLSDSDKLPSTFDGFSQMGSFIKSLKA
ncbi:hypothetical protein CMT41_12325 [Colwellia sp. MT41]|uniref:hypothetical protein n=1 Tax=Colwellia sp. MT41 TaxID=58049 RepID=UPI0007176F3A|nr:hypothetical protein [Colwellia sp. MT41]ALO35417.1 hypothetical protein CMT41_12325 [Colwellia sp. MT41]